MATNKEKDTNHVSFRNGDLFCYHCGQSHKMQLPMRVELVTKSARSFTDLHEDCQKTWTEPVPETNGKSEIEIESWWLANGERGVSSETMFYHLSLSESFELEYADTPSDPSDFNRCHQLLQAVPHFKARLNQMKDVSDVWANLVENWDKLTQMLEQNKTEQWKNHQTIGMYEFMKILGC